MLGFRLCIDHVQIRGLVTLVKISRLVGNHRKDSDIVGVGRTVIFVLSTSIFLEKNNHGMFYG